jgi:hypothetical protein
MKRNLNKGEINFIRPKKKKTDKGSWLKRSRISDLDFL